MLTCFSPIVKPELRSEGKIQRRSSSDSSPNGDLSRWSDLDVIVSIILKREFPLS